MLVKIKLDGSQYESGQSDGNATVPPLVAIARFCGCAPCQIVAVNGVKTEKDLVIGQDIWVPVVTKCLVREIV